jgi:modulator of FtsH protease
VSVPLENWANFFLGQLTASAALAGLLFVSMSVNQSRILSLGRMAERGLEALTMLLVVLVISSLALIPAQTARTFGGEVLAIGGLELVAVILLQKIQWPTLQDEHRSHSLRAFVLSHVAAWIVIAAGAILLVRGDWYGLYVLPLGVLFCFVTAGVNAWVLLIEINR